MRRPQRLVPDLLDGAVALGACATASAPAPDDRIGALFGGQEAGLARCMGRCASSIGGKAPSTPQRKLCTCHRSGGELAGNACGRFTFIPISPTILGSPPPGSSEPRFLRIIISCGPIEPKALRMTYCRPRRWHSALDVHSSDDVRPADAIDADPSRTFH